MSRRFVLGPQHERERLDKVLARLMPEVTRATLQRWIAEGRVLLQGRACRPRDAVGPGDVVEVEPGPPPPTDVAPDPSVPFAVLFEDEHLIVVDKPAGVVVHPGRGHHEGTLVAGLLARPGSARLPLDPLDSEASLRPGVVQRLDKETSGVLVVAKDETAREGLKRQLQAHSVERVYRALTVGVPPEGTIETLHARHRASRFRFTSRTDQGRRAVTEVTVEQRLASGRVAVVACRLQTGRTHQIRVHLAERAKTPILADRLYGRLPADEDLRAVARQLGRQALHAQVLGFVHPVTGETLRFEAPWPPDLDEALEALRAL